MGWQHVFQQAFIEVHVPFMQSNNYQQEILFNLRKTRIGNYLQENLLVFKSPLKDHEIIST